MSYALATCYIAQMAVGAGMIVASYYWNAWGLRWIGIIVLLSAEVSSTKKSQ